MQILKPIVHETIWGGVRLLPLVGQKGVNKIGHLYCCIDTKTYQNEIIYGTYKGRSLHEWFESNKNKYHLENFERFPVITALVDAADNLSIQVHPDDAMAKILEGECRGKNESFYIIEPPETGWIYNGCKAKSIEEFKTAIEKGEVLKHVDTLSVTKGDYIYVTGGTLHAATRGTLSFEIEENCEHTYRFYDFDRRDEMGNKRPLQITKALASLDVDKKSRVERYRYNEKINERLYSTQILNAKGECYRNPKGVFSLLILIDGYTSIADERLSPGQAVIMEGDDVIKIGTETWMLVQIHDKENC